MAIVYLDVDDEITTAAARIRTATDLDVALVLPAGSRIATSRINFRLLAHEAAGRSRRLAIVAPRHRRGRSRRRPGSRCSRRCRSTKRSATRRSPPATTAGRAREPPSPAAAAAAGVAVASDAAGAVPATGATTPGGTGAGAAAAIGAAAVVGAAGASAGARAGGHARPVGTSAVGSSAPTESVTGRPGAGGAGAPRGPVGPSTGLAAKATAGPARRRRWPLVVAVLLALGLIGGTGAAVGYVVLPSASVTLELAAVPVGPIAFEGTADPAAVAVDAATATIPATLVEVPLAATGTFKATGKRVEASAATGRVRWTNCDPTRAYTLPKGTLARTPAGVSFATQEAVFLPVAILDPPRITCSNRTVDVLAQREGPSGNVAAGSITVVPGSYDDRVVRVTNLEATSGGEREVFPQVAAKDVAGAVTALTTQLDEQLAEVAQDPPGVPVGATVYPETALRGDAVPSVTAEELVGQEVETFELTLTAEGTVVAADPSPLEEIGLARIEAEVPEGMELREGSAVVEVGEGIPQGQAIQYPVTARAEAVREIGEDEVRDLVKGLTAAEAEEALAPFGTAAVVLWPDWATTVTTLDARLDVTIVPLPPADGSPGPTEPPESPASSPPAEPTTEATTTTAPGEAAPSSATPAP